MKIFFIAFLFAGCSSARTLTLYKTDEQKTVECQIVNSENYGKWPLWKNKLILVKECK